MSSNILIEDKFTVNNVNKDGKIFKKVSRINAKSEIYEIEMELDVNFEIYPMEQDRDYMMVIAKSLSGNPDQDDITTSALMDEYQYVMYGKVFKISEGKSMNDMVVYSSFGGLMMILKGNVQHLKSIQNDIRIYILVKSV